MTVTIKHAHQTAIADDGSDVGANAWNADHSLIGGRILEPVIVGVNDEYYVATTGNDSDTGLFGHPWLTIQHAVNYVSQNLDMHESDVHIYVANGTYTQPAGTALGLPEYSGQGSGFVYIVGNGGSPSSVVIDGNAGGPLIFEDGGSWIIYGCTLGTSGSGSNNSYLVWQFYPGNFGIDTCRLGSVSLSQLHCDASGASMFVGSIEVVGTAPSVMKADFDGFIHADHGALTLTTDPNCSNGLVFAQRMGRIVFNLNPSSGTNSGLTVKADIGGHVNIASGATIPGTGSFCGGDAIISSGNGPTIILNPSFVGDSGGGGSIGYVPAPAAGDAAAGKFLKADATWAVAGSSTGANPTATGGDVAVNGSAVTFLRSDGAPAIQKTSSTLFGLCKVDNSTITASGGVITAVGGAATTIAINVTGVTSSVGNEVLYGDGTLLQQASKLQITSGQPNVTTGSQYLYASLPAIYATTTGASDENWFVGRSGNLSVTGHGNICFGREAGAGLTSSDYNCYLGAASGRADTGGGGGGNVGVGVNSMNACTGPIESIGIGFTCLNNATSIFKSVVIGYQSLFNAVGSLNNVAVGHHAMFTTTGTPQNCVAVGTGTLNGGTALGNNNTALGNAAGAAMTSGSNNCLIGGSAGAALTTEASITCVGFQCGQSAVGLTTGDALFGYQAGIAVTSSGGNNLGIGTSAFAALAGGGGNVALGASAMSGILGGSNNMGIGSGALTRCTSGNANVGVGQNTLAFVTTTASNVAIGQNAGQVTTGSDNIFIGTASGIDVTTGSQNLLLGGIAGGTTGITTGSGNVLIGIGFTALGNPSNAIIIGTGATPTGTIRSDFNFTKANGWVFTASAGIYTTNANFMLRNTAGLTGGGTGNVPTLLAGPVTGDPTKWLPYDDNGTTRYIPSW